MTDLSESLLQELSGFYRVFGDPTRLRILTALRSGRLCVHELSRGLKLEQSTVSHQLRVLKNARVVRYRREGREIYYELSDNHVAGILDQGTTHVGELLTRSSP